MNIFIVIVYHCRLSMDVVVQNCATSHMDVPVQHKCATSHTVVPVQKTLSYISHGCPSAKNIELHLTRLSKCTKTELYITLMSQCKIVVTSHRDACQSVISLIFQTVKCFFLHSRH